MSAARAYRKERDEVLRALDRDKLDRFLRKWKQPRPRTWIDDAWLAMMHKTRLDLVEFTEAEKAISRTWLAQNGYTQKVGRDLGPCPACGGTGPSQSDCPVCGMEVLQ
ncbi:MAG TPA: hypothetical protein VK577_03585 [Bradyrhizobium sp.]|nr:hypothetical protein [Bradyrhizobium sp.]